MRFLISYFYQIRFFTPNMIPISTAVFDPKWYKGELRKDGRGVWIGFNDSRLHPSLDCECPTCTHKDTSRCHFITDYYNAISKVNFQELLDSYESLARALGVIDPIIVLLVHEVPTNPCSERSSLIKLFKEHGIELEEFNGKKEE